MILRQFQLGFKPVFSFALAGHDMYVHSGLFSGEEVESIAALSEYGWAHLLGWLLVMVQ